MKTIKDAVIELGGKLPAEKEKVNGWTFYNGRLIYLKAIEQPIVFTPEQFESCAKRLGYINGYRWGVEYPTNGKRLELADDGVFVWLDFKVKQIVNFGNYSHQITDEDWSMAKSFRIDDGRYKPVSEISESKPLNPSVSKSLESKWFEAGELPPVGVRCEAAIPHTSGNDNERSFIWIEGSVIAYYEIKGNTYAWFAEDDGFYPPNVLEFRPIKTDKEKAIEAAVTAAFDGLKHASGFVDDVSMNIIVNSIYDAGMLVLPGTNCNTKA